MSNSIQSLTKIQAAVRWKSGVWSYYTIEKGRNIERFASNVRAKAEFTTCSLFQYEKKLRIKKVGFITALK